MELPEIMLQHGVKIVSDEEYKEMCKIDERFCTSDDFETETKKEKQHTIKQAMRIIIYVQPIYKRN